MTEQTFQAINRHRKSGALQEAWDLGLPAVQENPSDRYLKGAFFWVCYDFLKQVEGGIKERAQKNSGNYTPNFSELERINFYLDWIVWLNIPTGGFEYRSLLLLFQKNLESVPKLVSLLLQVHNNLFDAEDKIPYQSDKGESPSLMLKFARKVAKSWMDHDEIRQLDIESLLALFDYIKKECQDKQHIIWLDYDEAKCLIMAGRLIQAREFIIPVLLKKQTESWAWGALAATYRKESPTTAIKLFCKALCHAGDEKFSLPLLRGIAPLLAANGQLAAASMCVRSAIDCYVSNGWKIKPELEKLSTQAWYDNSVNTSELSQYCQVHSEGAVDLLHGPSEQCVAIILSVHQSGKGFDAYINRTKKIGVRLRLFKGKSKPKAGDYVRITLSASNQDVISAEPCEFIKLDDVSTEAGELRVAEGGFGFVNDCFIPPYLITEGDAGRHVNVTKVYDFNKKKNQYSWKGITLDF